MLSLSMISDYLNDNPETKNRTLRRTRASTRAHLGKFDVVYKKTEKDEIIYDFNGKEYSIHVDKSEEYEKIVKISSHEEISSEHRTIFLNLLSEKLRKDEEEEETLILIRDKKSTKAKTSKKRKISNVENGENVENDLNSVNVEVHEEIQIKKKKKVVDLPADKLKNAENLTMRSLIKQFGNGSYEDFHKFCIEKLQEHSSAIQDAHDLTIEQADTKIWHELRIGRITASRIHEASRCTMTKGSLTDKFMGKSGGFSFAMMRGTVLEEFVFEEVKKEFPDLQRSGLIINANVNPFFAASPDGIHEDFVLEIKCPGTPNTFLQYTNIEKLSRKYFAQIQLQMHVTGKRKALLAVASLDFEKTRNITKIWIPYDEEYVDEITEQSLEFYQKAVFPALKRKYK